MDTRKGQKTEYTVLFNLTPFFTFLNLKSHKAVLTQANFEGKKISFRLNILGVVYTLLENIEAKGPPPPQINCYWRRP
jgi:hypothetical protein